MPIKKVYLIISGVIIISFVMVGCIAHIIKTSKEVTNQPISQQEELTLTEEQLKSEEKKSKQKPAEEEKEIKLETYKAELFIEAKWGEGEGEVGIFRSGGDEDDMGPRYGPQSFDVNGETGHLFLLDSINSRVIEYDESGKYLKDFPIACGGTGDIKVSPDYKYLYIWSGRCGEIYKYNITGEFLESYPVVPEKNPGLGIGGMIFDENGNIMIDIKIKNYDKESRFYQIGKNGNEWKKNNCEGYISKDGKEYYLIGGIIESTGRIKRQIRVLDRNNELKRTSNLNLSRDGFPYFVGLDEDDNIYLEIQYSDGSKDIEIQKYNQDGDLLAVIDVKEMPRINNFRHNYTLIFKKRKVFQDGNVYLMFSDINKIKIYKYSQIN